MGSDPQSRKPDLEAERCAGDPDGEMFACGSPAALIVMQLRPGYLMSESASAEPVVVMIGVCREHLTAVRRWLHETWQHDQVDVYGVEFVREHLARIEQQGPPVLQLVPTSLAG